LPRAIARLEGRGQLDQRVGHVRMAPPFRRRVGAERAPAVALGRSEPAGRARGDGALVRGHGDLQVALGARLSVPGDGCLRAGIVAWAPRMSPPSPRSVRRRFFAPEVIQTSAMDCGPAALKCLLEGFGVPVSYGRLREACQTDVDGTSIDTIEVVANQLGIVAEQMLLPTDHLFLRGTDVLPALIVIDQPNGGTHFVIAWRRLGPWLQVMDPSTGRGWTRCDRFVAGIHRHAASVPAADWRAWAGTDAFLD